MSRVLTSRVWAGKRWTNRMEAEELRGAEQSLEHRWARADCALHEELARIVPLIHEQPMRSVLTRSTEIYPVWQYQDSSFVNPLARAATSEVALRRPVGRIRLCTRESRIECQYLRAAFTMWIWGLQEAEKIKVLPACTWCGLPTGCWCDDCRGAVCTECDHVYSKCRRCEHDPGAKNLPPESQGKRA